MVLLKSLIRNFLLLKNRKIFLNENYFIISYLCIGSKTIATVSKAHYLFFPFFFPAVRKHLLVRKKKVSSPTEVDSTASHGILVAKSPDPYLSDKTLQ